MITHAFLHIYVMNLRYNILTCYVYNTEIDYALILIFIVIETTNLKTALSYVQCLLLLPFGFICKSS